MSALRCINFNHRRANSPVRICPMCGEMLNRLIPEKACTIESHQEKRKAQNTYCCDCGEYLPITLIR